MLRRDIRSRRNSINSAGATELSTVRYLLPGLQNRVQSTRFSGVRGLGTAVDSGVMGMTGGVILQSVCRRLYVHIRVGLREYYTRACCVHIVLQ